MPTDTTNLTEATATIDDFGDVDPDLLLLAFENEWRCAPHAFAEHVSGGKWKAWPYLEYIGNRIAATVKDGGGRIIINMPPGHGKSSLLSLWLPIWLLDNWPELRIIGTSHGAELAADWGRKVRNEFDRNPLLTTKLSLDSTAADRWNTAQGGGMLASGVGGGITGFRANLILIDDPHPTWEAAMSAVHRERVVEWFDGTLYDRQEPGATIIVLMHRWHEEDLAGYLIGKHSDKWEVIRLPAVAEPGDLLARSVGEPLCPERFNSADLNQKRLAVGANVWFSKYQQNPQAVGAGRLYGRFVQADHETNSIGLRDDLPLQVAFDFNRNPGMHVEIGQYDPAKDQFTCVYEIYDDFLKLAPALDRLEKLIMTPANQLAWGAGDRGGAVSGLGGFRWKELVVFGDATGTQERAETTRTCYQMIEDKLRAMGVKYSLRVPSVNPPIITRIDTFNEALCDSTGEIHYRVHPRCLRLLADLKGMKADEQGLEDKRDTKLSHASSAEGYRVCALRPIRQVKRVVGRVVLM